MNYDEQYEQRGWDVADEARENRHWEGQSEKMSINPMDRGTGRETTGQRIEQAIATYTKEAAQRPCIPHEPDQLAIVLTHDGKEEIAAGVGCFPVYSAANLEIGRRYQMRKIDECGATYNRKEVTVLALPFFSNVK